MAVEVTDAFGLPLGAGAGGAAGGLGFAGQYVDQVTGLYDMRARDYQPGAGRFTTTDPVRPPVGMSHVNGYSYAFNNPLG